MPGELVQIDTLFINIRPDKPIKHFTAYDPVAKWACGHVPTQASASAAKTPLDKHRHRALPHQRHPGRRRLRVHVRLRGPLSRKGPRTGSAATQTPRLNRCVERAQSTWRYEFYGSYDLPRRIDALQPLVDAFAHRFNHYRPHQSLGDRTPAEYPTSLSTETAQSHML